MKGRRKTFIGKVVSDKMKKTRCVVVERRKRHKLYKKVIRKLSKFKVHDEREESRIGDIVKIEETRPLSKEKRWRLVEIIERSKL